MNQISKMDLQKCGEDVERSIPRTNNNIERNIIEIFYKKMRFTSMEEEGKICIGKGKKGI